MGKYYAVRVGHQPGIYLTWPQCQAQVNGYPRAEYKSFTSRQEAEDWYQGFVKSPLLQSSVSINNETLVFYTDGSYRNNKGGWSYLRIENDEIVEERSGPMLELGTTNNRAELIAVRNILHDYPTQDLVIHSDSEYTIKAITTWYHDWRKRGWRKADGKTPDNLDLIHDIINRQMGRRVTMNHVYSHQGNPFNERCDELAKMYTQYSSSN